MRSGDGGRRSRSSPRCRAAGRRPTAARAPRRRARAGPPRPARRTSAARAAPRARRARRRCGSGGPGSPPTRAARPRAAAGRGPRSRRSKKIPSRRPASVTSSSSKPPCSIAVATTTAPPRITSPRSGLMPRTEPRLDAGLSASSSISSSSASRVSTKPCTSTSGELQALLRRRGQVADRAAEARQPQAASPASHHSNSSSVRATWRRSALSCLELASSPGRKASLTRTAPRRHRLRLAQAAVRDAHDLHAAAAHVDPEAVRERGRVGDRQVAVPRLLGAGDHPHVAGRSGSAIARSSSSRLAASRMALVATASTRSTPDASRKAANTAAV